MKNKNCVCITAQDIVRRLLPRSLPGDQCPFRLKTQRGLGAPLPHSMVGFDQSLNSLVFIFTNNPWSSVILCINWLSFLLSRTRMMWSQLDRDEHGAGACALDWRSCSLVSSSEAHTSTSILHFRYRKKIFKLLFATFMYL